MQVSFSVYVIVVLILSGILAVVRYKTKDENYDDMADLSIVIGCILFWPFVVSVLMFGIVIFLLSIPFIIMATLISWIISLFKKDG